jgi:hypothetical protein
LGIGIGIKPFLLDKGFGSGQDVQLFEFINFIPGYNQPFLQAVVLRVF